MRKFALLKFYPLAGRTLNLEINEISFPTKRAAVDGFQKLYPELNLDKTGCAKHGEISYCVMERFSN